MTRNTITITNDGTVETQISAKICGTYQAKSADDARRVARLMADRYGDDKTRIIDNTQD